MNIRKVALFVVMVSILSACADKNKLAQETARTLFKETANEECKNQIKKNTIVAILLANKEKEVNEMCGCVSDDVFNHVSADEILTVATDKEARKKIAVRAAGQSVMVCAKKLNYIK